MTHDDAFRHNEPKRAPREPSITDFLTDGSLPSLCETLSEIAGTQVALFDQDDRRITLERTAPDVPTRWSVGDQPSELPPNSPAAPIKVDDRTIGKLAVLGPSQSATQSLVSQTATIASEVCQRETDLLSRAREVSVLFELTGLLSHASDMDALLRTALDSALDVLELDAGSMILFQGSALSNPTEEGVVLKAGRGLSDEWLNDPTPLSTDRTFDRLALSGEVIAIESLCDDPRTINDGRLEREGLVGFMSVGMIFQDRPLGVIRVYSRKPRTFTPSDKSLLRSIAQQAAVAVAQTKLLMIEAEDQEIQRQLRLAGDVQRRMLPRQTPDVPGFELAARYIPSYAIGGDFYDCFEIDAVPGSERRRLHDSADLPKRLALVVGDVVGSGVPAALLMASVRSSLRAFAKEFTEPEEIVNRVNKALARDTLESEFVTLWLGIIDPETLLLSYCSAGHEPPFVVRVPTHRPPTGADIDELAIGGMVLGIDPSQRYQRGTYDLSPGDLIVAYTDGLTEAQSFDGDRFRRTRVRQALLNAMTPDPNANPEHAIEHVLWSLRQFAGLNTRVDDLTLLATRVQRD